MEENEVTMLKSSRLYVEKSRKWMNVFSIFSLISIVFIVLGGFFLLYYSSTLPEDMPHYIDNLVGMGGLALIVIAAALLPAVVRMRRAIRIAHYAKITSEAMPIKDFEKACASLWHYMTLMLIGIVAFALVALVILYIYVLPTLSTLHSF